MRKPGPLPTKYREELDPKNMHIRAKKKPQRLSYRHQNQMTIDTTKFTCKRGDPNPIYSQKSI